MKNGMSWQELLVLVANASGETIYMVMIATFFTVLIGLPLGVLLFVSRPAGVLPAPRLNTLIGALVNVGRSMPFVVLLIALIPHHPLDYRYHTGQYCGHCPYHVRGDPLLCAGR